VRLPARKTVGKALRRTAIWLLPRTWPLPPLLRLLPERDRRLIVDMWTIRRAGLFDAAWYRRRYPDVAAAGTDVLEHYCRQGWRRGRDPSPHFSTTLYLVEHPEAGQAGNPLVYFAQNPTTGPAETSGAAAEPEVVPASAWYDAATPQLAVVILNFNRAALTLACVASLLRHTEGLRFEIVAVDNGSEPDDFGLLARSRLSFRLLRLRHNVYFGEGNNLGVEAASAPLICLMNNDVIVTAGWLGPMLRLLHGRPNCGAVGPKFLYPDGRIQEAGALVDATGDARRMGHGAAADDPRFGEVREVDYVSAAAVLLSKADFERAGGFDPCWDPAYYEDTDLCLKLAVLGRKTWYCPDAAVIHHESVTTTDPRAALNIDVLKQVNRGIFVERWGRWLTERKAGGSGKAASPPPLPTSIRPSVGARAAASSLSRDRLALLSFEPLLPGGRTRRLLAFAEALSATHIACIATPERSSRLRVLAIAESLGLGLGAVETLALDEIGGEGPFDLAVVLGNGMLPPVPAPAARSLLLCDDAGPPAADELTRRCRWWSGYQSLLAISEEARSRLSEQLGHFNLPMPPVEVLPPSIAPIAAAGEQARGAGRHGGGETVILNVAGFHAGSEDHHQRLIEAFRQLSVERGVAAELHLAGAVSAQAADRDLLMRCRQAAAELRVFFHINASRPRLLQLYRRADAYWHDAGPAADGKDGTRESAAIALLEAMAAGCVCFGSGGKGSHIRDGSTGCAVSDASDLIIKMPRMLDPVVGRARLELRRVAAGYASTFAAPALQARYWRVCGTTADAPAGAQR